MIKKHNKTKKNDCIWHCSQEKLTPLTHTPTPLLHMQAHTCWCFSCKCKWNKQADAAHAHFKIKNVAVTQINLIDRDLIIYAEFDTKTWYKIFSLVLLCSPWKNLYPSLSNGPMPNKTSKSNNPGSFSQTMAYYPILCFRNLTNTFSVIPWRSMARASSQSSKKNKEFKILNIQYIHQLAPKSTSK